MRFSLLFCFPEIIGMIGFDDFEILKNYLVKELTW
jgi:hypothetical protein